MKTLKYLFDQNVAWADEIKRQNPQFFETLAIEQKPKYLWIGCSDSRIPASEIMGLKPGEVFVHRNVANLCPENDVNYLAALQFSVEVLNIEHIIVCGHYNCGGVIASLEGTHLNIVDSWLDLLRNVIDEEKEELDAIEDPAEKANRLSELNIIHQVRHVEHTSIVRNARKTGKALHVHGWIYDLSSGLLKDLGTGN